MGVMGAKQAHSSFLLFFGLRSFFCLAFLRSAGVDALKSAVARFLGVGNAVGSWAARLPLKTRLNASRCCALKTKENYEKL